MNGWGDVLASCRWQAIVWTNDGQFYWHKYASLGIENVTILVIVVTTKTLLFQKLYNGKK